MYLKILSAILTIFFPLFTFFFSCAYRDFIIYIISLIPQVTEKTIEISTNILCTKVIFETAFSIICVVTYNCELSVTDKYSYVLHKFDKLLSKTFLKPKPRNLIVTKKMCVLIPNKTYKKAIYFQQIDFITTLPLILKFHFSIASNKNPNQWTNGWFETFKHKSLTKPLSEGFTETYFLANDKYIKFIEETKHYQIPFIEYNLIKPYNMTWLAFDLLNKDNFYSLRNNWETLSKERINQ